MKTRSIVTTVGILVVAVVAGGYRYAIHDAYINYQKPPVPSEQPRSVVVSQEPNQPQPTPTPEIRGAINLAVPFSSQAPRGDWSLPWQEACEETSALLVDAFWRGVTPTEDEVVTSIQRLVDWQKEHLGFYQHTTAAETATMIRSVFGYRRVDVTYGISIEDLRREVRAGRPVIVPLAGRLLGNPFYTVPGPAYHMLIVKGVADNGDVITNDVGTRHGRNLTYSADVFLRAMHDVPTGGDDWSSDIDPAGYVLTGRRAMIVVYPN